MSGAARPETVERRLTDAEETLGLAFLLAETLHHASGSICLDQAEFAGAWLKLSNLLRDALHDVSAVQKVIPFPVSSLEAPDVEMGDH